MERRRFLTLAGVGVGMCVIPPALYFVAPEVKLYAIRIIEKELYYLKLDKNGVRNYVNDYFNARSNDTISTVKWKVTYYLNLSWENSGRVSDLIKYYLLSSDFFINKTDESRVVHYLGLFNSYTSPVPNPYAFTLYPPTTIGEPE